MGDIYVKLYEIWTQMLGLCVKSKCLERFNLDIL